MVGSKGSSFPSAQSLESRDAAAAESSSSNRRITATRASCCYRPGSAVQSLKLDSRSKLQVAGEVDVGERLVSGIQDSWSPLYTLRISSRPRPQPQITLFPLASNLQIAFCLPTVRRVQLLERRDRWRCVSALLPPSHPVLWMRAHDTKEMRLLTEHRGIGALSESWCFAIIHRRFPCGMLGHAHARQAR